MEPSDHPSRRDVIRDKIMQRVAVDADGCWIWQGRDSGSGRGGGYPRFEFDGGTMAVHRAMWIVEHGPIPPRKQLDHTCRKRMCVNPFTCTELVTHKENQRRRVSAKGKA